MAMDRRLHFPHLGNGGPFSQRVPSPPQWRKGATLLAVYSLGLGIPSLLVALVTGGLLARFKVIGRIGQFLQILAGGIMVLMVLMGIAMITGQLSTFSFWLLETFPGLSTIR